MSRKNHVISIAPVIAIILAISVGTPVRAQLLVFDPSNYSQNLLTAARSLQQIQNQITSLQNQAQMLINQAKQLEQLPTTVLNDVERDYSQIQNLLRQANGITYNVQSVNQAFSQSYPASMSATTSDQQLIAGARQRWQDSLSAFQHALTLGAGAVQNLPNTQAQTGSLLSASQSSVGILQATQAGNQLVAVQTRQLGDLTALVAAQGRSQALEAARKAEAEGQAQEQLRRFLSTGQGYQPARGGATMAGGAATAYGLAAASSGETGLRKVGAGMAGVAKTGIGAAAQPLRKSFSSAASSLQGSAQAGPPLLRPAAQRWKRARLRYLLGPPPLPVACPIGRNACAATRP
jgi:type IV secretion system protein TrbJ